MREMLRGAGLVAILVLAFATFDYQGTRDNPPSGEVSAVSSSGPMLANDLAESDEPLPGVVANGVNLISSVSREIGVLPLINGTVVGSGTVVESDDSNGDGTQVVSLAPDADMTPVGSRLGSSGGAASSREASSPNDVPTQQEVAFAAAASPEGHVRTRVSRAQAAAAVEAEQAYVAERPFSASTDCKFCHPRQYQEWRTSPHSYSGISPTFYSLVSAGQNSFGAGAMINNHSGVSQAGAVGNFCLPCHSPMAFIGLEGRLSGNGNGFSDVISQIPFVCDVASTTPFIECTAETSADICGAAGRCTQFEGRTCVNMPPVTDGTDFPRERVHCSSDSECSGTGSGCPAGEDCGPCIIGPSTIYYSTEAQEGINCESCHNILPNHRRACQQFRNSDSVGVLSIDLQERSLDGTRLRLGPYPVEEPVDPSQGRANDAVSPRKNAFHESARVDTPLAINYEDTDYPNGFRNPNNDDVEILRPTSVTCEELPFCRAGLCEGGTDIGGMCSSDFDCGGCSSLGECGPGGVRAGQACRNSVDCATPADATRTLMDRAIDDGTLGPLFADEVSPGVHQLDRPDGNFYRSSEYCGACHDVRPPFGNSALRSCQEQDTHVCSTDADCLALNVGCTDNDCGPCVMENGSSPAIATSPTGTAPAVGDPRNTGVRRVENLFSEWQISAYNHPDHKYCSGNAFRSCDISADCGLDGTCTIESPVDTVVTCQDCHMSLYPRVPLVPYPDGVTPGTETPKNDLYPRDLAAIEGSQTDISKALPERRVSTHYMAGVDLPLVKFSGQATQVALRQELLDSAYKIEFEAVPAPVAGDEFEVELLIENVGVGHRLPAGFSHERQNWVQMFVQTRASLGALGLEDNPFAENAPCNLQRTIATGADQALDVDYVDQVGAQRLSDAGCVYRSGFILDKAHPETGEMTRDGSMDDEDPEDFFVVVGTRMRGLEGEERIEVTPGAEGRALSIQYICEEATEEAYLAGVRDGTGIDMLTPESDFPHQVRFCNPNLSPQVPGEGVAGPGGGFTAPGFGNPDCMEGAEDVGPCVPEIELSDADERGRCAHDLARPSCQSDSDCGDAGPCLYVCSEFFELQCCDETDPACAAFYSDIGSSECMLGFEDAGAPSTVCVGGRDEGETGCTVDADCADEVSVGAGDTLPITVGQCESESNVSMCIGGLSSGQGCTVARETELCPGHSCGSVGECVIENRGIVNFQNQFRTTTNGVCVDAANARDGENVPIPLLSGGEPVGCILDLSCTLEGLNDPDIGLDAVCLVNGQCAEDSGDGSGKSHGDICTNVTYREDCGLLAPGGDSIACNVERNVELNGRPSESVFIQNHPFNFNSLPPLEPRIFKYDFVVPAVFANQELVMTARVMNRHFPMRFLRNLIGTQVIRPPFISEHQGDPDNPDECSDPRTIDIDCFVRPVAVLGNAEPGGYFPAEQEVRSMSVTVAP